MRGQKGGIDQQRGEIEGFDQQRADTGGIDQDRGEKVISSDVHRYLSTKSVKVIMPIKNKKEDNVKCELCNTVIKLRSISMFIT